jgi:hypothetical protein
MVLLGDVGQVDAEVAKFWTEVQTQSAADRAASFQINSAPQKKRRPRSRRRRNKPQAS